MLNVQRWEREIEAGMAAGHVPGVALAVVSGEEVLYARGFGATAVEGGTVVGTPVTPDTLFRIGSVTKPLTGTAAMRLVELGKLDLDAPLTEMVPWLKVGDVAGAAERITMRHLLSHVSGLKSDAEHFGPRDPGGLETFVREIIPTYGFVAPPGTLWSYSNPGLSLAGYILQVVGGRSYAELMQELVFDPLGMTRTTFDPTVAMTYPLAQSHDCEDGVLHVQHRFADNVGHYPAGFAMSTVLDLANFAMMQLHEGRWGDSQVLAPASVAAMQRPEVELYLVGDVGYGLTFFTRSYKGVPRVGHRGGISSYVASLEMVPEAGVAVVLLANRDAPELSIGSVVNGILDGLLDLPEDAPDPVPFAADKRLWAGYVGSYLGEDAGLAQVRVDGDTLALELNHQVVPLTALRDDLYFGPRPGEDSGPTGERWTAVGFVDGTFIMVDASACRRIEPVTAVELDEVALSAYTGTYATDSHTLRVRVATAADGSRLVVKSSALDQDVVLTPLDADRFTCQYGIVTFRRDDAGDITMLAIAGTEARRRREKPRASEDA